MLTKEEMDEVASAQSASPVVAFGESQSGEAVPLANSLVAASPVVASDSDILTKPYGEHVEQHLKNFEVSFTGVGSGKFAQPVRCRAIDESDAWSMVVSQLGVDPTRNVPAVKRV